MLHKKIFIILAFSIITIPAACEILDFGIDRTPTAGTTGNYEKPRFNKEDVFTGAFQQAYENYFGHTFKNYFLYTALYNEFRYDLFNEGTENVIVGKNKVLFEPWYIEEKLGLIEPVSDERINYLCNKLSDIQNKGRLLNKGITVLITPSKANFLDEYIPDKYSYQKKLYEEEDRAYYRFVQGLEDNNIDFVDSIKFLKTKEGEYDIFPKTGTHWSDPAKVDVSALLLEKISERRNIKKIVPTKLFTQNNVIEIEDNDLLRILNIFQRLHNQKEYQYLDYETEILESYENPKILMQGGSFGSGIYGILNETGIVSDLSNIFYSQSLSTNRGGYTALTGFNNSEVNSRIAEADEIILEVNEQYIANMGNGFLEYLDEAFDKLLEPELSQLSENVSTIYTLSGFDVSEIPENSGTWVTGNHASVIIPKNENKTLKQIQLEFLIPSDYLISYNPSLKGKEVKIYVNGKLKDKLIINDTQTSYTLRYDLQEGTETECTIDFVSPGFFIPRDIGINDDFRKLSIYLTYIGEIR